MDPALVVAITGVITGIGGMWLARRRDTTAAASTAKDVASRAADAAVGALNAALSRLQGELEESAAEIATLKEDHVQMRADNRVLLAEIRQCHDDKAALEDRVRRLEEAQP